MVYSWWLCVLMLLLIHCGLVALYGIKDLSYHWSRWWLVAYLVPNHYLNKWLIGPIRTNFSEIWIKYSNLIKENTLEKYCRQTYNHFVPTSMCWIILHINGLAQYCGNSSALAMELPQSCVKPSICQLNNNHKPTISSDPLQWQACGIYLLVVSCALQGIWLRGFPLGIG